MFTPHCFAIKVFLWDLKWYLINVNFLFPENFLIFIVLFEREPVCCFLCYVTASKLLCQCYNSLCTRLFQAMFNAVRLLWWFMWRYVTDCEWTAVGDGRLCKSAGSGARGSCPRQLQWRLPEKHPGSVSRPDYRKAGTGLDGESQRGSWVVTYVYVTFYTNAHFGVRMNSGFRWRVWGQLLGVVCVMTDLLARNIFCVFKMELE